MNIVPSTALGGEWTDSISYFIHCNQLTEVVQGLQYLTQLGLPDVLEFR